MWICVGSHDPAIQVLLIANIGVRKGDVNDASTRVSHWTEGGRIADPRGD